MRPEGIIEKAIKKIKPKQYKYVAAATAAVLILFIFSSCNMLSNGTNTIIGLDMEQQYFTYIKYMMRVLKGENSFWFSWANEMGKGIQESLVYYTFSPVNLIYLLFPNSMFLSATAIVITVKIALSAFFMQIFLSYFLKKPQISSLIFAICYALCSFHVLYYFEMCFQDAVYLLPLIMYCILLLIRENKIWPLTVSYVILFAYNFYMAYITGICSFILAVAFYLYNFKLRDRRTNLNQIFKYAFSVISSFLATAVIWLPAAYQLLIYGEEDRIETIPINLNPIFLFNNLFVAEFQTMGGFIPYIYCGLITFVLFVLLFLNGRINKKVKIYAASISVIFTVLMCVKPLNKFMHAFDSPQNVGSRYAFVFSFVICVTACYSFQFIRYVKTRDFIITGIVMVVIYTLAAYIYNVTNPEFNSNKSIFVILINVLFLTLSFVILYLTKCRKIKQLYIRFVLVSVIFAELSVSYIYIFRSLGPSLSEYTYDTLQELESNTAELLPKPCENDFYRVQALCFHNNNVGLKWNFNSLGSYNTFLHKDLQNFIDNMGMEVYIHHLCSCGLTDIIRSIFSVRYVTNMEVEKMNDHYWYVFDSDDIQEALYHDKFGVGAFPIEEYKKDLSIGFMAGNDIEHIDYVSSPFDNQNMLISKLCGEEINCYEPVEPRVQRQNAEYEREDDGLYHMKSTGKGLVNPQYATFNSCIIYTVTDSSEKIFSYIKRDKTISSNSFLVTPDDSYLRLNSIPAHNLVENYIMELGKNCDGEHELLVYLQGYPCEDFFNDSYFVKYNEDEFNRAFEILSEHQLLIEKIKDGYLKGNINVDKSGIMFTSIPFSEGWKALVDGNEAQIVPICNGAFCGIRLDEGNHNIEMMYSVPKLYMGIIISIIGVVLLFIYFLLGQIRRKGEIIGGKQKI